MEGAKSAGLPPSRLFIQDTMKPVKTLAIVPALTARGITLSTDLTAPSLATVAAACTRFEECIRAFSPSL